MISGSMVEDSFTRGWALKVFGDVAHYWMRRKGGNVAVALCNKKVLAMTRLPNGQVGLFHQGDYPRCKRCDLISIALPRA